MKTEMIGIRKNSEVALKPMQVAYLAGYLEGEGCFGTYKKISKWNGKQYTYPRVVFATTDYDVAKTIATMFGVNPCSLRKKKPHHKPIWQVCKAGVGAAQIMRDIYPFMGDRRKSKIDEIQTMLTLREGEIND